MTDEITIDLDDTPGEGLRVAGPDERTPWTCDVCRRRGPWTDEWRWYGSYRAQETCGHIVVICSTTCRDSAKAKRLIAAYDADHGHNLAARKYGCTRKD
jgi:hypothetical protein